MTTNSGRSDATECMANLLLYIHALLCTIIGVRRHSEPLGGWRLVLNGCLHVWCCVVDWGSRPQFPPPSLGDFCPSCFVFCLCRPCVCDSWVRKGVVVRELLGRRCSLGDICGCPGFLGLHVHVQDMSSCLWISYLSDPVQLSLLHDVHNVSEVAELLADCCVSVFRPVCMLTPSINLVL